MNSENKKSQKGSKTKKVLIIILLVILGIILLGVLIAGGIMYNFYSKMNYETIVTLAEGENMSVEDLESRLQEIESYEPEFGDVSYVTGGESDDSEYYIDWDEVSRILAGETDEASVPEDPTTPDTVTTPPETLPVPPETLPVHTETESAESTSYGTTPITSTGTTKPIPQTTAPETQPTPATTARPNVTPAPDTTPLTPSNPIDPKNGKIKNILLIGRDLTGKYGLSDVMIIVSINDKTGSITLTSMLRDTYVYIPANGGFYNRLNASHSSGGTSLLINTIKRNFGITIDNYIKVDFGSVQKVFDILGGIDIGLSTQEIEYINGRSGSTKIDISLEGQVVHLNGAQLLAHCRNRSSGNGDWGRTDRQRKVITAIFNKLKTKSIGELNDLLNQLFPLVTTDITFTTFTSYILKSPNYMTYNVNTFTIPTSPYWYYYRDAKGRSMIRISNMTKTIALWQQTINK